MLPRRAWPGLGARAVSLRCRLLTSNVDVPSDLIPCTDDAERALGDQKKDTAISFIPSSALFQQHFAMVDEFNLSPTATKPPRRPKNRFEEAMLKVQKEDKRLRSHIDLRDIMKDDDFPDDSTKEGSALQAHIAAALRGRQGFIGKGTIVPVALESRCTYSTATTPDNIRRINASDRHIKLRVPLNSLCLSFQAKRRMAGMLAPKRDGLLVIRSDRFTTQRHNEQRVKSILVQLHSEARLADHGNQHWANAVVKVPKFTAQRRRIRRLAELAEKEEQEAQDLLTRWAAERQKSVVPIFADALYPAYQGDKSVEQLMREKDAAREKRSVQEDAGFTLL